MLNQTEILTVFEQALNSEKSLLKRGEMKKEAVELCAITLDDFDQNMMVSEQYDAGTAFAENLKNYILLGQQIKQGLVPNKITKSWGKYSQKSIPEDDKMLLLFRNNYSFIMACYSKAITKQLYLPGEKSDASIEKGLQYIEKATRPFTNP